MKLERLNPDQFKQFCEFIYEKSGIRINDKKVTLLSNRIRHRLKAGDFEDFDTYYRFLTSQRGADELEGFLDAITTNETFFFRTAKHFDWLKNEFLTELIGQHRAGQREPSLRIWSAGCANGAEPYSIAVCLAENAHRLQGWSLKILGTDISEQMLAEAREGKYKERAVEAIDQKQRRRYFHHRTEENHWAIRPDLKELVEFKKHNLMDRISQGPFDCIFIRNVLIYFDRDSKRVVIENLVKALKAGGYLVVGPSEGIYDMLDPLQRLSPLIYQKPDEKIRSASSHGAEGRQR